KRRILVLRPRHDLPALLADPLLPHAAAKRALQQARTQHIPYDFAMDARDHGAEFCSEVASAAYEAVGIELWPGQSSISSPGIAAWLASFGVRHFETQEPADLEYDPQLSWWPSGAIPRACSWTTPTTRSSTRSLRTPRPARSSPTTTPCCRSRACSRAGAR